ncbi:MAG: hypothetical protein AB1489_07040 [Acidobacteriota bacterium]
MRYHRMALLFLCFSILLGLIGSVEAQSGRRPKRSSSSNPVSTPTTTPVEEEEPPPSSEPEKQTPKQEAPRFSLIATTDVQSVSVPSTVYGLIMSGFAGRLKETPIFDTKLEKQMTRKEATDLAKTQTEVFVVWLQFGGDAFNGGGNSISDYSVDYFVFQPGTAKLKSQGRVYLRPYSPNVNVGSVPVQVPLPLPPANGRSPLQYSLEQAGREAGDRVISAFAKDLNKK